MPYIATNAESYVGKSIGDGQCVAFVYDASSAPITSMWQKGDSVKKSNSIISGTIIATFNDDGKYDNEKNGLCHAAVFLRKTAIGIVVLDQWITNGKRQVVHERTIRFNNNIGKKVNNGDEYYVVN